MKKKTIVALATMLSILITSISAYAVSGNYYTGFTFPRLKGDRTVEGAKKETNSDKVWNKLSWMGKGNQAVFYVDAFPNGEAKRITNKKTYSVGNSGNLNFWKSQNKSKGDWVSLRGYTKSWEVVYVSAKGKYDLY